MDNRCTTCRTAYNGRWYWLGTGHVCKVCYLEDHIEMLEQDIESAKKVLEWEKSNGK